LTKTGFYGLNEVIMKYLIALVIGLLTVGLVPTAAILIIMYILFDAPFVRN